MDLFDNRPSDDRPSDDRPSDDRPSDDRPSDHGPSDKQDVIRLMAENWVLQGIKRVLSLSLSLEGLCYS